MGLTWIQRQYLSQLYANEEKIPQFSHVSWQQTVEYVQVNGEESLPKTSLDDIFFDLSLTFKEFVKDFDYMIYSVFRQCGLGVFYPALGFWIFLKSRNIRAGYLSGAQLFLMLAISFLIISYIEIRWLAPVFIMSVIGLEDAIRSKQAPCYLNISNMLILLALGLYGSWRYLSMIRDTQMFQSLI